MVGSLGHLRERARFRAHGFSFISELVSCPFLIPFCWHAFF